MGAGEAPLSGNIAAAEWKYSSRKYPCRKPSGNILNEYLSVCYLTLSLTMVYGVRQYVTFSVARKFIRVSLREYS